MIPDCSASADSDSIPGADPEDSGVVQFVAGNRFQAVVDERGPVAHGVQSPDVSFRVDDRSR
jgi:hypothetical protein